MQDLLILGSGAHGAEMAQIVGRINDHRPTWNLLGLIAPREKNLPARRGGPPVLGLPDQIERYPHAALAVAFEWLRDLRLPMEQAVKVAPIDRIVSLVDPSCFVSDAAVIGRGCVLYPQCFVGLEARLGDFVFCLAGAVINHECVLEDRVTMCSRATLAGGVKVAADCYLGQACTVRQQLSIGRDSLVGMGAVVVKDVPPNSVMAGNPARRMRDRRKTGD